MQRTPTESANKMTHPQTAFQGTHTTFSTGFLAKKRSAVFKNTLPYQLHVLRERGYFEAYDHKWEFDPERWPIGDAQYHLFWESDIAKWIEAACYSLYERKNEELVRGIAELVDMLRANQHEDGYLNLHYTLMEPGKRFTNLRDMHELYNAGHLIEAAIAHKEYFRNSDLMKPILKYVDLLCATFGPAEGQIRGYPGHPEIELALCRLFELTNNPKHLALARFFLTERGNPAGVDGKHYYDWEAEQRGERLFERPTYFPTRRAYSYQQAHKPLLEQHTIEGHAVRAMYLLAGLADVGQTSGNDDEIGPYCDVLTRLWKNMVEKKMYLTGGIGSVDQWEGFGIDYSLPQSSDEGGCYAETCASVGVILLAERMLHIAQSGKYSDVMELCLYNTVLGGMSCDGLQFTYTNQLASSDGALSERKKWFNCACCPMNVARLLGSLGGFIWHAYVHSPYEVSIYIHLYESASLFYSVGLMRVVQLEQESNWPWEGKVKFNCKITGKVSVDIYLRTPSWATGWTVTPMLPTIVTDRGYLKLPAKWLAKHSEFCLHVPMQPRLVSPHPFTNQNVVAIARGPLVYCVEDCDNPWVDDHFKSLIFDEAACLTETRKVDEVTKEEYVGITARGQFRFVETEEGHLPGQEMAEVVVEEEEEEEEERPATKARTTPESPVKELHFVPFYFRANRPGKGHMRVGLRKA
ncbi:DUF1680-domain-containing protein [Trichodelitschia bisporula]|uniref:DUF1680-domain-containing protein n=1 Tax=Trichodelitschia bisporula TaxID=703511 RepID=A0A6G1HLZ8_9PEZI|nr:DUF1680-domain-containing protein [Trichodelitschia bisporula]